VIRRKTEWINGAVNKVDRYHIRDGNSGFSISALVVDNTNVWEYGMLTIKGIGKKLQDGE
jgi:hypothetical protein